MRSPRYPLQPLVALRGEQVDAAVRGLATAVQERERAEAARWASEQQQDAHARSADSVRRVEQDALCRGELSASDLAAVGAWELRVRAEAGAIQVEVERSKRSEAGAREAEQGARGALAAREADAKVIEKDRERWHEGARKKAEAEEEEEAAEAYRPGR
ncbi:MAG TPA: hypothetical protein VIF09_23690 [Polyangiaceae bacterium]|jgi:hypothetical protein